MIHRLGACVLLLALVIASCAVAADSFPTVIDEEISVIFAAKNRSILAAEVATTVVEIHKEMGQTFKEGEPLITLDSTKFKANFEKAKAQIKTAEALLASKQSLFIDKQASQVEVENARLQAALAKADYIIANKELQACTVRAPYNGRVVTVYIKQYENVQMAQKLIEVVDDSVLRAQFLIPASYRKYVTIGKPVTITVQPSADETVEVQGTISHVGAVIDPASSTIRVFAEVENADAEDADGAKLLYSGMRGVLPLLQFKE